MSGIGPSVGGNPYQNDPIYPPHNDGKKDDGSIEDTHSKLFTLIAATLHLKKCTDSLIAILSSLSHSQRAEKALKDLIEVKKQLEELAAKDKSHEPDFTNCLSLCWQSLQENFIGLKEKSPNLDPLLSDILGFIEEISHFPEKEEFSLGYYLMEHAGQKWIPFPFMDILKNLHDEYQRSPTQSPLGRWILTLKTIAGESPSSNF